MSWTPHGMHLIAGDWVETQRRFASEPVEGAPQAFCLGSVALVQEACEAAEEAFWSFGYSSREGRAAFLEQIATEIDARLEDIAVIGRQETGLPDARMRGECGRTTGQLRLFAEHIRKGTYLDLRHDEALPDRAPLPRPDLRMMQRPIGPVAVFGASNFPLAFSVAGGDTAAALAAGCPVVVKGHSAHPGTSEIVAEAIHAAIKICDLHPGVFSLIQGGNREVGAALVQHPLIKAVGFTGSLAGGRALFDLCAQRPEPIPFFGELGSVNPMFILPEAAAARSEELASGWASSLTLGAGQFCTNPGIAIVMEDHAKSFADAALAALEQTPEQVMLTHGIASAYRDGCVQMACHETVHTRLTSASVSRSATPQLCVVKGADWLAAPDLEEEVFGPLGLIVTVASADEMMKIARHFKGQLTCTLHLDKGDTELAQRLMPVLERKAGRILANGFPTGVEVSDTMVHGGPYPASTNFGATSVGTLSIRRFLRPVCFQNIPAELLPADLVTPE
ncbi:aldehyde dehydrogenase family protein [Epibacterium sp. SM1979]|uniref:Aldehyde dehydrogenase family protein n=1 Tax=Tritonibacter litoralis TaxID=2662264 RepID=A0A843YC63_9RHOB|nr:aldehyde dehydrogenase (NADP(+)) [Tritonibacter litoralis]MQQ07478.1 aldehyde dehydrogenase family protein [Tritonibacter litoralis]